MTFTAVDDATVEPGESVRIALGSLPAGYVKGSTDDTVVHISDDDVVQVSVSFSSAAYTVAEGAARQITVNPECRSRKDRNDRPCPRQPGRGVVKRLRPAFRVAFGSGETAKTVTFSATQDLVDDDDESVRIGFSNLPSGVAAGTPAETVVAIEDDDVPQVTVGFALTDHAIPEGISEDIAVV